MNNSILQAKKSTKIVLFLILLSSFSLFIYYYTWLKSPEIILTAMYDNERVLYADTTLPLFDEIHALKLQGFSEPIVFKSYEKGIWSTYVKLYKYSKIDGSVLESKSFLLKFKIRRPLLKFFNPEISQVIEFVQTD